MKKLIFFQPPHSAPRCHGTLSILSITHANYMKGLGLLTFIPILFSKCVCFLILFEISLSENSPETGTSCDARSLTYSEVVQGISSTYLLLHIKLCSQYFTAVGGFCPIFELFYTRFQCYVHSGYLSPSIFRHA